jgi:hypothetical protein
VVRSISPTDPIGGSGTGPITVNVAGVPAELNAEGLTERVSDILIYDDNSIGTTNCFAVGNSLRLSYNAALTSPASITSANNANFDVFDSNGAVGLTINASSSQGFSANAPQTVISISVLQGGTAATSAGGITSTGNGVGSAVRIKNLRLDATTLSVAGNTATATVSSVIAGALPAATTVLVGTSTNTIAPGAGFVQQGSGTQSSNSTLNIPAILNFGEGFGTAFRVGGSNVSGVFGDIATNPTSLIFDLGTTIPQAVTVTFPSTINTSAAAGTGGIVFTLRSGGACVGPANCVAIYDTTANGPAVSNLTITTALAPNSGANGALPAIGVFIPNPSGFGTATLGVSFGPGVSGGANDDVNANAIPRYLTNTSFAGPTRRILAYTSLGIGQPNTGISVPGSPSLTSISPTSTTAGAPGLTLTVTGSNFAAGSVVLWNGSPRATNVVSSTELSATIAASDLATAGTATVSVVNAASGGATSNAAPFSVVTNPQAQSALTYLLPHVVTGDGYVTKITIVNTSNAQNAVVVNFISQAGVTLQSTSYDIAPGGTLRVSTPEAERYGPATTKWATVGAQKPALVNLFFEYKRQGSNAVQNSVGFNDAPPLADFSIPVEHERSPVSIGQDVGLALANGNAVAVSATLKLVDSNGTVLGTQVVNLPAFGQAAFDLRQIFDDILPSGNFVGSVTVSATAPIAAIALADNDGPFSATPVGAGRAR